MTLSVLGAVERLLKARGFDVETFRTIDSFIERANLRAATCLVLDINLNGASGIELKRKLNAAGISPPVIFITARDEDVTRRAALSAGCVAYLSKPFSSKDLVDAIEASQKADSPRLSTLSLRSVRLRTMALAFENRSLPGQADGARMNNSLATGDCASRTPALAADVCSPEVPDAS